MPLGWPLLGRRMVDIKAAETSGVDHPAHLTEGWAIIKAAEGATSAADLVERLKAEGLEVEKMAPAALATMLAGSVDSLPDKAKGPARALIAALGGTTKEAGMPDTDTTGGEGGTGGAGGEGGTPPTLQAQVTALAAQVADLTTGLTKANADLKAANDAKAAAESKLDVATKALGGTLPEPSPEDAFKAALGTLPEPIRKAWEQDRERLAKAEKLATDERDARLSAEYLEVAKSLDGLPTKPEELATILRKAADTLDPKDNQELLRVLKAVDAQVKESGLFKEVGGGGGGSGSTAWDKLVEKATALQTAAVAAGNEMTRDQAIAKAGDIFPDLVRAHQDEAAAAARDGR